MATATALRHSTPARMSRRVVEWGILGTAILLLVIVFLGQARQVQDQAELAAVRTTLAALRTAAVLQYIQASSAKSAPGVADLQQNPFNMLQSPPHNYAGVRDVHHLPEGLIGWFYDPQCKCVGYAPAQTRWQGVSSATQLLLFQVRAAPGPLQLFAMEDYQWQGEPVR